MRYLHHILITLHNYSDNHVTNPFEHIHYSWIFLTELTWIQLDDNFLFYMNLITVTGMIWWIDCKQPRLNQLKWGAE